MERGIGRTGYLLLAFVLFAVGALGLVLSTIAFMESMRLFFYLGAGTAGVAMFLLFVFASVRPLPGSRAAGRGHPRPSRGTSRKKTGRPAQAPPPPGPEQTFEYDDSQPAAPAAPEEMVLPDAFRDERPPGAKASDGEAVVEFSAKPRAAGKTPWPERRAPVPRPGQAPPEPASPGVRAELTERYTRDTPMVRQVLGTEEPRDHVAERAPTDMNTDFVPPNMSVGRCGQCQTLLLAPDERPIRLKCPDCGKVTLLN